VYATEILVVPTAVAVPIVGASGTGVVLVSFIIIVTYVAGLTPSRVSLKVSDPSVN
jgi:hypothetical protein